MLIFLNGSINSGKSTVAKILVEKIPKTALLEIDSLRAMINWMPLSESIPLNLENAVSLIKNFTKQGLNVVIPYPLSQKNYDYFVSNLSDLNTKIFVFTLAPKLEIALTNRGTRALSEAEKDRIKYHYEIGIPNPSFGQIIDNSALTPDEVVALILNAVR